MNVSIVAFANQNVPLMLSRPKILTIPITNGMIQITNIQTHGPNITAKDESYSALEDAKEWAGVKDKMKYFSEKPGEGD